MKTTRTVVHGPGGSTTVTEYTSYSGGGGGDFGGDFGGGSHFSDGFGSSGHRFHSDGGGGGGGGRRSKSGWGTRHGGSEPKRPSGPPMKLEGKTYDEIKAQCLRENRLFEDPDFPPNDSSVFPSKRPPRPFEWKRPTVSDFDTLFYTRLGIMCICYVHCNNKHSNV